LPKVSIIMPAYNAANYIGAALASLQLQSYSNWECIIINDGSTDNTVDIVHRYANNDSRILLINFTKNQGRSAARQAGLDRCDGEYVAMLDADDAYFPEKLALQVNYLEANQNIGAISSKMIRFDDTFHSSRIIDFDENISTFSKVNGYSPLTIPHAPTLVRLSIVKGFRFDTRLKRAQDLDFIMHIINQGAFALIPSALYAYRMNSNISKSVILDGFKYQRIVIRKWTKKHPIRYLVINYLKVFLLKYLTPLYNRLSPIYQDLNIEHNTYEYLKKLHQ